MRWWQYLITGHFYIFLAIKQIYIFKRRCLPTWRNYSEVGCEFRLQQLLSPDVETCTTQSARGKGLCWRWFQLFEWNLFPKLWLLLEIDLQSHFQQAAVLSGAMYASLGCLQTVHPQPGNPYILCVWGNHLSIALASHY